MAVIVKVWSRWLCVLMAALLLPFCCSSTTTVDYSRISIPRACFAVDDLINDLGEDVSRVSEMEVFDAAVPEELVVGMTVCYNAEKIVGIQLDKG